MLSSLYRFEQKYISPIFNLKNAWLIPLFIFIVNMGLRLIRIDTYSLWYDEVFTLFHCQLEFKQVLNVSEWDINPPLYGIVMHYWCQVFGFTSLSARLLSVFFGSFAAVLIYLFSKKYLSPSTAIFASILFLASHLLYFYSHEARAYTIIIFLVMCSTYAFFSLLEDPKIWKLLLLGGFNFLIFYTHYLAGLFFVAQGLISLLYIKKRVFLYYALSYIVFVLCIWHWKTRILQIIKGNSGIGWLLPPNPKNFLQLWTDFLNGELAFYAFIATLVLSFGLLMYTFFIKKQLAITKNQQIALLFLFVSSVVLTLISYHLSHIMSPMFLQRYLLFTIPFFLMFFAFVIGLLPIPNLLKAIPIVLIAGYSLTTNNWHAKNKMDYKNAVPWITAQQNAKSMVFLMSMDMCPLYSYYLDKETFANTGDLYNALQRKGVYVGNDTVAVNKIDFSKFDKLYLTQTFETIGDPTGLVKSYFDQNFELEKENKSFEGVKLFIYKNLHKPKVVPIVVQENDPRIKNMVARIKGDLKWMADIQLRAQKEGVAIERQLILEAKWMLEHP